MALHFRRLVSLILLECLSQKNNKSLISITLEEYENFLKSLQKPRGVISGCVRDLFVVLFGNSNVSESAKNLVATWIRRIDTLSSVSKVRLIPLMYS